MTAVSAFSLNHLNVASNSQISSCQVVSLNPDAIDEVGHFLAYDDSLYETFQRFNVPFISLCNRAMKQELLQERPYAKALLTTHSWDLGNYHGKGAEPPEEIKAAFRHETLESLDLLTKAAPDTEIILYIYCGSLYHAEQFLDILQIYPRLRAVITLFWLPFINIWQDGFRERWQAVLQQCSQEERLTLTLTTLEEQEDFHRRMGYFLPVSPHPSTTIDDPTFFQLKAQRSPQAETPTEFLTLFPGNLLKEKGYELTFDTVRSLAEESPKLPIRSLVRVSKPDKVAVEIRRAIDQIKGYAETLEGGLNRSAFIQLIRQSHIIVLPYRPPVFAKRTSGLLIDAIYCGVPVVVMDGTWLGNFVVRTGCGVVVKEPTGPAIARAIKEIASNYPHYCQVAFQAGTEFFQSNNWMALAASIIGESAIRNSPIQAGIAKSQVVVQGLNSMNSIQSQEDQNQRNGKEINSQEMNGKHSAPQENSLPVTAEKLPVPLPPAADSASGLTGLTTGLLGRIARYYSRWPLPVAVLGLALNAVATIDDIPFRFAFSVGGNFLLLFLVGHAASKADVSLQTADRAQNSANQAQTTAEQGERKATSAFKKASRAIEQIKTLSGKVDTVTSTARSATETANRALATSRFSMEATNRTAGTARSALEAANRATEKADSSLDLAKRAIETNESTTKQLSDRAIQEIAALEQKFDKTLKNSLNSGNVKLFQPFERQLTSENIEVFTKVWLPILGLPLNPKALGYLAHHICLCEDTCSGRLATTVQDMLLRILIARSVKGHELSVLEIGSLFGINLATIYDLCRDYFETIHLSAVDPLDGYYGQSYTDLITQVPVTRKIFEHNMRQIDVPVQDITLIQGLSTEATVLEKVGLKQYNLLVIDGDHSYAGVKFDFDHYLSAVDVGGYIIFDDYGSVDWPDVAEFVDKEVRPNPCVEFVGASWRTAVFRVVRRSLG